MKKQGIAQILLFLLAIFCLSGIIIGGSFYIKSDPPQWIKKIIPTLNENSTPNKSSSQTNLNFLKTATPVSSSSTVSEEQKAVLAVIEAMKNEEWPILYSLISSSFAGKSQQDFVETMKKQQAEVGKIVDAQLLTQPIVTTSPQGIKNFTVKTSIGYLKNNIRSTVINTDHYVWENNTWKFWFSTADK